MSNKTPVIVHIPELQLPIVAGCSGDAFIIIETQNEHRLYCANTAYWQSVAKMLRIENPTIVVAGELSVTLNHPRTDRFLHIIVDKGEMAIVTSFLPPLRQRFSSFTSFKTQLRNPASHT